MFQFENKKKRRILDIATKKNILEASKLGYSHQKIADMFEVGRSTVTKLLLRKDIVSKEVEQSPKDSEMSNTEIFEAKLLKWCKSEVKKGSRIVNIDLINKASLIAKNMKFYDVEINSTWVTDFCGKFQLDIESETTSIFEIKSNVPEYIITPLIHNRILTNQLLYLNHSCPPYTDNYHYNTFIQQNSSPLGSFISPYISPVSTFSSQFEYFNPY
ncbi:hypothetical protein K502DRAFT_94502 [Neoconidiobolus thromboides FSU 785]|nr:hypothetical protein K502DRAFT_94502 [Neoconidiobolus thromboides FSU 785]